MTDSDVVIRVEGLGKKYALHHDKSERYTALRDVVARQARAAGRLLNPFTLAGQLRKAQRQAAAERAESEEEFWALKDVSFEIRRGERVGIIGRNGAGKSTLLKILSRITEPTTGRVEIRGRVASLLEVGTGFHPELTGRENIYLNGAILGMTRREIRSKFDEIVDFAEVEKFLDTPVKRYSSGMYVRLAFAVAAHLEPEILVVDEVLAVGDTNFQAKCLGQMHAISKSGRTLLFVSHDQNSILRLCHSAFHLEAGRIFMHGEAGIVLQEYSAFVSAKLCNIREYLSGDIQVQVLDVSTSYGDHSIILEVELRLSVLSDIRDIYYAFDIKDCRSIQIGQAFSIDCGSERIKKGSSVKRLFRIHLPGLIPGEYCVGFWIGPHNNITLLQIDHLFGFSINQSPSRKRVYPHSSSRGIFASKIEVIK